MGTQHPCMGTPFLGQKHFLPFGIWQCLFWDLHCSLCLSLWTPKHESVSQPPSQPGPGMRWHHCQKKMRKEVESGENPCWREWQQRWQIHMAWRAVRVCGFSTSVSCSAGGGGGSSGGVWAQDGGSGGQSSRAWSGRCSSCALQVSCSVSFNTSLFSLKRSDLNSLDCN